MENKHNEQVIYLKDLIFAVLYQWKKLLVAAVALALLLGGFQGISGLIKLNDTDTLEAVTKQNQIQTERYEAEVKSLETQIDTLRDQVSAQQEYLDNSLLMQLDPYNHYEASLSIYIETDYQIMPEMTYQDPNRIQSIIHSYTSLLTGNDCLQSIADQLDTEPRYLKEMLTATGDGNTCVLHIVTKAATEEQANELSGLLLEQFKAQHKIISNSVDNHRYSVVEQSTRKTTSITLADQQKAANDRLSTLLSAQTTAQSNQAALVPPSLQSDSGKAVLKNAVVFAVIGGVLAVFVGVVILWVSHIASVKIYSARTLTNRTGLKAIGILPAELPKNSIDQKLLVWEGRSCNDPQVQAELTAIGIRNHCMENAKLLLTGSTDPQSRELLVSAVAKAMPQVTLLNADDILSDVSALEALNTCDAVVLVEKCHLSRYNDVDRRIDLIQDYSKQLLGCVLYGG